MLFLAYADQGQHKPVFADVPEEQLGELARQSVLTGGKIQRQNLMTNSAAFLRCQKALVTALVVHGEVTVSVWGEGLVLQG